MKLFTRDGRRAEDATELGHVLAPRSVEVLDAGGNRWRIRDARYGQGLEVTLAEAADGTQAMHVEPETSNTVTVRPRGTR